MLPAGVQWSPLQATCDRTIEWDLPALGEFPDGVVSTLLMLFNFLCRIAFITIPTCFLCRDETTVTVTGPVTITSNQARYRGGAIYNEGTVVLPSDADISDNDAIGVSLSCCRYHLPEFPQESLKQDAVMCYEDIT